MCVQFVHVFLYQVLHVSMSMFRVLPFGCLGGSQEACSVCGPVAVTLGGGWFCGGAEAVRRDSGGVDVHPPEEHACRQG